VTVRKGFDADLLRAPAAMPIRPVSRLGSQRMFDPQRQQNRKRTENSPADDRSNVEESPVKTWTPSRRKKTAMLKALPVRL
jgi:hypothetical protein